MKQFELEDKYFKPKLSFVEKYYPPTILEEKLKTKFKNKIGVVDVDKHVKAYIRQAGIWFSYYKDSKDSDYDAPIRWYDKIVYLPKSYSYNV
jgi:hypothetical protein